MPNPTHKNQNEVLMYLSTLCSSILIFARNLGHLSTFSKSLILGARGDPYRRENGASLIEVLVAILICSTVCLSVSFAMLKSLQTTQRTLLALNDSLDAANNEELKKTQNTPKISTTY